MLTERLDSNIVEALVEFMEENIDRNLEFYDFVRLANISPTRLKTVFKNKTGMGGRTVFQKDENYARKAVYP